MRKQILPIIFKALYITGVLLFPYSGYGQDNSQLNWPIGDSGLGFSKGNKQPSENDIFATTGTGGVAIANDPVTGDVLFYTDGNTVYDASHNPMAGTQSLGGNTSANPAAVISPIPGEPGRYLIFTNNAGTVNYTIVDMNAPGNALSGAPPLGAISSTATTGITNASDAFITIKGDTDDKYWLLSQVAGTNRYRVFQVAAGGSLQSIGEYDLGNPLTASSFSYSASAGKIAVTPQESNVNVQILNFNNATGELTFDQPIFNSGYASSETPAIFDTEWSSDGTKLYISQKGSGSENGSVQQYDFNDPTVGIQQIVSNTRSYGLALGPDGNIYHIYQTTTGGSYLLGRINDPDNVATSVTYESGLFNNTNFNAPAFPFFAPAQRLDYTVSFKTQPGSLCQNNEINFFPEISPMPDSVVWDFGDGSTSTQYSPVYTYEEDGQFPVTLTAYWGDISVTSGPTPVTIIAFDVQLNLQDTTVCSLDEFPFDMTAQAQGNNAAGLQYFWSTGVQGETASIDSPGYYWVVGTNGTCSVSGGFNAIIYGDTSRYANVWYFGNGAGIDFNEQPPVALTDGVLNAPEGTATMSDRNGNLLFYTDGQSVWNREHAPMVNGDNIGGSPNSAQSSIIIPFPGNETLFYIFTTDDMDGGTYRMTYSIVDIKGGNGFGEVISKDNVLFVRSTERITAVGSWMLAHEFGNNTFRAYEITTEGIGNPILSSEGSVHSIGDPSSGESYMKFSSDGTRVAVAVPGTNKVELFNFTDTTGVVDFFVSLDVPQGEPYGIEFSPDNTKLYVSTSSAIYQYEVNDTLTAAEITAKNSPPLEVATGSDFGAIQQGPDGQLYVAINNSGTLGVIDNPNGIPGFRADGFDLQGKTSLLGLPNFIQNIMNPPMSPGMTVEGVCLGTPTNFSGTGTSNIDQFFWTISKTINGRSVVIYPTSEQEFTYDFDSVGVYYIALQITNRCGLDTTLQDTIQIIGPPDLSSLPETAALCGADLELSTGLTDPGLTFLWTTGATTPTITVTRPSIYGVTVTNAAGCPSNAEVFVVNGGGPVDLGPDRNICQHEPAVQLDAGNPQSQFTWYEGRNGANPVLMPGETSRILNVNTTITGPVTYVAQVTDPINGCITLDTINIMINGAPTVTATATSPTNCGDPDGSISYIINETGFYSAVIPTTSYQVSNIDGGPANQHTTPLILRAGMYDLEVTSNLTGCTRRLPVAVPDNNPGFTIDNAVETNDCERGVEVTLSDPAGGYTYDLRSTTNPNIPPYQGGPVSAIGNTFTISSPIEPGTYLLTVTSPAPGNCVQTYADIEVNESDLVPFSVPTVVDGCISPDGVTITATGGNNITYTWDGPGIIGSRTGNTILVDASVTSFRIYTVTATQVPIDPLNPLCPATATVLVNIDGEGPAVSIVQEGDGCEGRVRLITDPATGFTHNWSWDNSTAQTPSIILNTPGAYDVSVTVRSQANGCTTTATYQSIVFEPLSVTLGSELACDNGEAVNLIATANQPVAQIDRYMWFNSSGAQLGMTIPANPTYPVNDEGLYSVTVRTTNNCEASASYNLLRAPFEKGELPPTVSICPPDEDERFNQALLDPGGSFISWEWGEEGSNFRDNSSFITVRNGGTYFVTMTNGFGCIDRDTTIVLETCIPRITGPNAIVPGGMNNRFSVYTRYVDFNSFEIQIFNRWGEIIFTSTDVNFQWDGTYKGKLVPLGTYPYVIRYRSEYPELGTDKQKVFHGGITVIR